MSVLRTTGEKNVGSGFFYTLKVPKLVKYTLVQNTFPLHLDNIFLFKKKKHLSGREYFARVCV